MSFELDAEKLGDHCTVVSPTVVQGTGAQQGYAVVKGPGLQTGKHAWSVKIVKASEPIGRWFYAGVVSTMCPGYHEGCQVFEEAWIVQIDGYGWITNGKELLEDQHGEPKDPEDGWIFRLDCDQWQLEVEHLESSKCVTFQLTLPKGPLLPCVGFRRDNTTALRIEDQSSPPSSLSGAPAGGYITNPMDEIQAGEGAVVQDGVACGMCGGAGVIEGLGPCPSCGLDDEAQLKLAKLVTGALADGGWAGVDVSQVEVKPNSGMGGSKCYKVSAPGVSPPKVALHTRSKEHASDLLSDPRMHDAAKVFAVNGFAPRRLAEGDDWFVEPWEGNGQPKIRPHIEKFRELGKFVARYHQKLPTDWYDPWRVKLCEKIPALKLAQSGCHVWWWAARPNEWFSLDIGLDEECLKQWASDYFFAPRCTVAQRLVTSHGDLNEGNMLQMDDGLRCIDFEFSCVTNAVQDLSYVVGWISEDSYRPPRAPEIEDKPAKKRAFLKAYLQELDEPSDPKAVEDLLLDAEISWLAHFIFNTGIKPHLMKKADNPAKWWEAWECAKSSVKQVRESEELREKVLQSSFGEVHKELRKR